MDPLNLDEVGKVYASLQDATAKGDLKWERIPPISATNFVPPDATPLNVFRCTFEDASWLLAEYEERLYDGENDRWYDRRDATVSILEGSLRVFDFPPAVGLRELVYQVKAQAADVHSLIDRILKKKQHQGEE